MENTPSLTKSFVKTCLASQVLVSPDLLNTPVDAGKILDQLRSKIKSKSFLVLTNDINCLLDKIDRLDINWIDFERSRARFEKGEDKSVYDKFYDYLLKEKAAEATEKISMGANKVEILASYDQEGKTREIQDFVNLFNRRYNALEQIIAGRLQNLTSISRILSKKDRENISIIGLISDIKLTKNQNLMITVEDPGGEIKVLINKNKPDLFSQAKDLVHDEIIGISGANGDKIIFANDIIWPDVPVHRELKKAPDEVYAAFLSDIHVGSNNFLPKEFEKFIKWMSGESGSESQRAIARKTKYVFIVGDLVDGVGIYPGQEKELDIKDIKDQYAECARLLSKIPADVKIIICPGNHDATRIAEPQPAFNSEYVAPILELQNVIPVSNPGTINIHKTDFFPGFDVLLYHGYSFDYFVANVDYIRQQGGYDRADLIMKFLLKRRHLAPTYTSTLFVPDAEQDPLVIDKIPDFFITGHIHKCSVSDYRNITTICGSCWQSKTSFQEKVGHHPEPAKVPVVNLKTRQTKILRF